MLGLGSCALLVVSSVVTSILSQQELVEFFQVALFYQVTDLLKLSERLRWVIDYNKVHHVDNVLVEVFSTCILLRCLEHIL